jgi:translation initiation factor 2 beta subunit (eIF-2beta)/eIF-5
MNYLKKIDFLNIIYITLKKVIYILNMEDTFESMLDELYDKSIGIEKKKTLNIPPPELIVDTSRIFWTNPKIYLKLINRPPEHFLNFMIVESSIKMNWKTESKSDGIVIHSNKMKKNTLIELIKKYIEQNVSCKYCFSFNTIITKNSDIRKYEINCNDCNCNYTL